jgi:hypothetical protein
MRGNDAVDDLEEKLVHMILECDLQLKRMVEELRKCPYAGQVGASCKKVKEGGKDEVPAEGS